MPFPVKIVGALETLVDQHLSLPDRDMEILIKVERIERLEDLLRRDQEFNTILCKARSHLIKTVDKFLASAKSIDDLASARRNSL